MLELLYGLMILIISGIIVMWFVTVFFILLFATQDGGFQVWERRRDRITAKLLLLGLITPIVLVIAYGIGYDSIHRVRG